MGFEGVAGGGLGNVKIAHLTVDRGVSGAFSYSQAFLLKRQFTIQVVKGI